MRFKIVRRLVFGWSFGVEADGLVQLMAGSSIGMRRIELEDYLRSVRFIVIVVSRSFLVFLLERLSYPRSCSFYSRVCHADLSPLRVSLWIIAGRLPTQLCRFRRRLQICEASIYVRDCPDWLIKQG